MQTLMKFFLAALLSVGLIACQKGPAERAGENIDDAFEEIGDSIDNAT
jgi:Flp pilus assembly pilin Flp